VKGSLRERVRCSSHVDWPVYPRLRGTMQGSERPKLSRNRPMRQWRSSKDSNPPPFDARTLAWSGWEVRERGDFSRINALRRPLGEA
jgi:hypothetical protein